MWPHCPEGWGEQGSTSCPFLQLCGAGTQWDGWPHGWGHMLRADIPGRLQLGILSSFRRPLPRACAQPAVRPCQPCCPCSTLLSLPRLFPHSQRAREAELLLPLNIPQSFPGCAGPSGALSLAFPFACIFHPSMLKPSFPLPRNPQKLHFSS